MKFRTTKAQRDSIRATTRDPVVREALDDLEDAVVVIAHVIAYAVENRGCTDDLRAYAVAEELDRILGGRP